MKAFVVAALAAIAIAGCSSLVSDPCASGYVMQAGTCVARFAVIDARSGSDAGGSDAGTSGSDGGVVAVDAGSGSGSDAGVVVADAGGSGSGSDGRDGGIVADAAPAPDAFVPPPQPDAFVPPPPDAFVCELPSLSCDGVCVDAQTDPFDCGRCGHVCPTGICTAGKCVGDIEGHIVAIGHDYASHDEAMARVLGNAIGLGDALRVQVGWYRGTASAAIDSASVAAAASALAAMGRAHDDSELAGDPTAAQLEALDVLVVEAQIGSGDTAFATGQRWAALLAPFLARGGVVVVLDGSSDVSWQLAQGAGLYTVAQPVPATLAQVVVVNGTDAVAQQVPTPYLALGTSVSFGTVPGAVFATSAGATVVFHLTR